MHHFGIEFSKIMLANLINTLYLFSYQINIYFKQSAYDVIPAYLLSYPIFNWHRVVGRIIKGKGLGCIDMRDSVINPYYWVNVLFKTILKQRRFKIYNPLKLDDELY